MTTILYVEDHPPAQMLMQAIISELTPHTLVVASTGEEAVRLSSVTPPDLYILDLDLPDTEGIALARRLRGISQSPIILVSAYAEAIREEQFADVIDFYLAKPLDPDHVAAAIQRALA